MVLRTISILVFAISLFGCKPPSKSCDECDDSLLETGQRLYTNQCASCHGEDGKLGNSGATDLSKSELNNKQIREILSEGRGAMPPMLELVEEPAHMDSIVEYIKALRKE